VVALLLTIPPVAWAGYEEGEAANRAGDREAAFVHFQQAAERGDVRAYGKLAAMHLYGTGTAKDPVIAYVWFALAEEHGDSLAERYRMAASAVLTRSQLEQAHQLIEVKRRELEIRKLPPIK